MAADCTFNGTDGICWGKLGGIGGMHAPLKMHKPRFPLECPKWAAKGGAEGGVVWEEALNAPIGPSIPGIQGFRPHPPIRCQLAFGLQISFQMDYSPPFLFTPRMDMHMQFGQFWQLSVPLAFHQFIGILKKQCPIIPCFSIPFYSLDSA